MTRSEYDSACEQLSMAGLPLKPNREESWRAFVSIRRQYDRVLLALASFVLAPEAPWCSAGRSGRHQTA